uniref:helix-turn-helix domain-containing protein n=1 Tax=uncultured Micrococcus sp. TaxID=114051 RepID=UPI0026344D2D|nr:helix-turn-helix domain-containing protein [uncultured Micrococcus sp.]
MSIDGMKWAMQVAETGRLNTGQAFVLLLLGDHADERWSCWPSQELLARRSAQGLRTVERHIQSLKELGLVSTESMYGSGRGRVGLRYRLHEEALEALKAETADPVLRTITRPANLAGESQDREITRPANLAGESQDREITRPANLAGKSETGEITRPANLAGKSETGEITRPANLAGETTHPPLTTDSPANHDLMHIKDRARTNPQENHQSVRQSVNASERPDEATTTDGPTTTDEPVVHRGVDLSSLRSLVPSIQAWELPDAQVRRIVDVVLARASGAVQSPTRYVARAMASELGPLVQLTSERPPLAVVPTMASPASPGLAVGAVREMVSGEPCESPDVHVANYGESVLRDCPHCRIERRAMPRVEAQAGAGR